MSPKVKPRGLRFPLPDEAEKIIGKSGQIQGAKIVASPAKKLKRSSIFITLKSILFH